MPTETEVKLPVQDVAGFRMRLRTLQAKVIRARHFEDNYVLDFPDGRLRSRGCLLRVRITKDEAFVTFKEAAQPDGSFKTREELETPVLDGGSVLEILGRLGLEVSFRYQKYRTEYSVGPRKGIGRVLVSLDETPIGVYTEFEGSKAAILGAAKKLGCEESEFLRDSYYTLYVRDCRNRGVDPGHMTFG